MTRRWIVTGKDGQLGQCLCARLERDPAASLQALGRTELDLAEPDAVDAFFAELEPDPLDQQPLLVNAAAYTAVDRCEEEEALASRINGDAPARLAGHCAKRNIRFVHVSTDYVFDGRATTPYPVDAPTAPRTAYGRTKLAGEQGVARACPDSLIVRTSWVFGPGKNFVAAILRQAQLRRSGEATGPLRVVDDQRGCPTSADDLAAGLIELAVTDARGIFHLCNAGDLTWWDFARAILDRSGCEDLEIEHARTADLGLPAERPAYSVLDVSRAAQLGVRLQPWEAALADYLARSGASDGVAA